MQPKLNCCKETKENIEHSRNFPQLQFQPENNAMNNIGYIIAVITDILSGFLRSQNEREKRHLT